MMPEPATNADTFFDYFPGNIIIATEDPSHKWLDLEYNKYAPLTMHASNKIGSHIYFVVNQLEGTKRVDSNVVRCRAVFIDDDGDSKGGFTDREKFPIEPNLVVETSPGKYHYHWLTDTDKIEEWKGVQNTLITSFGGDPACRNPARIMRVPGYVNVKPQYHGWVAKLTVNRSEPYTWSEILEAFPPTERVTEVDGEALPFNVQEAMDDIVFGRDIHSNRVSLALHYVNGGMTTKDIVSFLNLLIDQGVDAGHIDKARAKERKANMPQAVQSAVALKAIEDGPKVELVEEDNTHPYTDIPMPPGALGEIAEDVMKYMRYPSKEMAVVVAQHVVSVFGGGKYHLHGRTCSRKRTVLAPTGRGKSVIEKYFNEVVRRMAVDERGFNSHFFVGSNNYAANSMHMELGDFRVRSYIINEAGLMSKSTSGNIHEKRRNVLNLVSNEFDSVLMPTTYSSLSADGRKANEKLHPLYGAVAVFANESVEHSYIETLQQADAFRGGDVGREEIFFIDPHKPPMKRGGVRKVSDPVIRMSLNLARTFVDEAHFDGTDPSNPDYFQEVELECEEEFYEMEERVNRKHNAALVDNDYISQAIYTRFSEKILGTMLVLAVADMAYNGGELTTPVATVEHLEYSISYHEELLRSLIQQTQKGALADPMDLCIQRVVTCMRKFPENHFDKKDAVLPLKNKIVRKGWFSSVLQKRFKPMQELARKYGKSDDVRRALAEVRATLEEKNMIIPIVKDKTWRLNI